MAQPPLARRFLDPGHPFYRPLWRRLALVVFLLGWSLAELWAGSPLWALGTGALGVFCAWMLLINFRPDETGAPR